MEEPKRYDRPVFTKVKDKQGREYKIAYSNKRSEAIEAMGDKLTIIEGEPSLFLRTGNSKYGEQLVLCLEHAQVKETREKKGTGKVIELYLPLEFGLEWLYSAVKYLGSKKLSEV